ncbi:HAMP domain-containing sensor histidine kinase [Salinicoccus halitifaciens]|uniref:histidine kinase n=1 Tax=Salinicoccus halitifaciens TaxID=1073415 RepID=A0ABV2E925_9STAP|nr:HAMP domain-containing sensor histidine kinase [Salinicoccus halitifaciens]MCD2137793.1 HAMP domain-containing histidine kinase [Salinicoccus halitifaciens]
MLNKLSLKIGLLFFLVILTVEIILFYILYTNLVDDRVEEVMRDLLARGNAHSDVLEENYTSSTIEHVAIMESESEFKVVVTDDVGEVITSSNPIEPELEAVVQHTDHDGIPEGGAILESDWSNEPYVSTDSPVTINENHVGHVFMFADSNNIKRIIDQLSQQFLFVGLLTVFLTIFTVFILSRVITRPLLKMKKATEQLSRGHHEVELYTHRKDELGELATSISRLSKDLERLKNERNEFLGSISHELRTPLTYMKGYMDIINRQDTTTESRKQYIKIIQEETTHLAGLIQNLFELAKIDYNEFAIKKEKIMLGDLIRTVVANIQPAINKRGIRFTVDYPDDLVAYVDPGRIRQVLLNILDNAMKYTNEGNSIVMTGSQDKDETVITISDTGEGIPEEDVPYIFERLYRAEKSRSRSSGGSGLGLAIAKEIVELHGGDITVETTQGEGTVFIISLPKGDANE